MSFGLRNLTVGYGETVVVRDVSVTVPDGAVVALLGPNGAGKTTLLRAACGLRPLRSGRIDLEGQRLDGAPPERFAAAGICHIPEGRGIFPSLTVRENLLLQHPARPSEERIAAALEVFPRVGDHLRRTAGSLSGGEQQMVALCRAIIARPRVILLDEVSMGLAPRVVEEIFAALRTFADSGASLLLVEQYVAKALGMADYVYVLDKGRMAACGEAGEFDAATMAAHYLG
ncbi:MAG TPA: ABC transporter ATP-binding protein [Acidimicrobiia bacterium]|nr:ABC transporter ATP-binding protein [Acidimicrobiia bacterium]